MALTLGQLTAPLSVDQWRTLLLGALSGLSPIVAGGAAAGNVIGGTGSIALSGTPAAAYPKVIVKIVTAGELGAAQFQYSLDGGVTYSGTVTIPAAPGAYVLGATGVTVTFVSGPAGAGTSFTVGDTFSFALAAPSLQVTVWTASGALRQLVEIEAQALASLSAQQAALAAAGLTTNATGSWADLLGKQFYGLTRNPAAATAGQVTITDAQSAGPFTIVAGQMTFASTGGLLYTNTTGGTLTKGGTLALQVQALTPGAAYNVGNNTITTVAGGTLPGVTVNNPDPGSGTWITSQGADAETDAAYMLRCQQRWPALGTSATASTYDLWAKSAEAAASHATTISKTLVIVDPTTAGQIDIYLAGASGAVGGGAVTDAQTYINQRVPLTATTLIQAATNVVITLAGTVNYFAAKTTLASVQAAVSAALINFFLSLGIGSDAGGANVKVFYNELLAVVGAASETAVGAYPAIRNVSGFTVNAGTADIGLTTGQVATLTNSLTFTAV
jgi:hypothetical protein